MADLDDREVMKSHLRILIVEDSHALRLSMASLLEAHGHQVDFAADGPSGLELALKSPPDVLVLDLGLPGMDGLRVCRELRLRSDRHIPILILTARDSLDDKVKGFEVGADDYLVKPFAGQELLMRCLALAKRNRVGEAHIIEIGTLRINRNTREVHRDGVALEFPLTSFNILLQLAESWPRTVTRSEIIQRLWGDDPPQSDPLRSHLYTLRQNLDRPFAKPMLKTIHDVGFKLESDEQ